MCIRDSGRGAPPAIAGHPGIPGDDRAGARRDNGDAVVHARITRADVVVVACCSVECDLAPATRVLPLQGYVLAAKGGKTQLTWVREADVADASALHAVLAANDARVDRLVARCVSPEATE